jgi:hypothetical protein
MAFKIENVLEIRVRYFLYCTYPSYIVYPIFLDEGRPQPNAKSILYVLFLVNNIMYYQYQSLLTKYLSTCSVASSHMDSTAAMK